MIWGVWLDEVTDFKEESKVEELPRAEDQPKPVPAEGRRRRIGRMKKDAHKVIHKRKVKNKNRAKNRVARKSRKKNK